jgi:5-formyltetrahydrofolate cyclo-ligase
MEETMIDLRSEKAHVRKDIRDQLKALSMEQWQEWSGQITSRLMELADYKEASTVMVFLSFGREFDTGPIVRHALSMKKTVCAPKVDWQAWQMKPIRITRPEDIFKDERGLPEPSGGEVVDADQIDLILVPGIAFDAYGRRLGRGGGFYDKFLSRVDLRAVRLAPTFDFQVLAQVPCDVHDERVDIVLTPTKTLRVVRRGEFLCNL